VPEPVSVPPPGPLGVLVSEELALAVCVSEGDAVGVGDAEGHVTVRTRKFVLSTTTSTLAGVRQMPAGPRLVAVGPPENVAAPMAAPLTAPRTAAAPASVDTAPTKPPPGKATRRTTPPRESATYRIPEGDSSARPWGREKVAAAPAPSRIAAVAAAQRPATVTALAFAATSARTQLLAVSLTKRSPAALRASPEGLLKRAAARNPSA